MNKWNIRKSRLFPGKWVTWRFGGGIVDGTPEHFDTFEAARRYVYSRI